MNHDIIDSGVLKNVADNKHVLCVKWGTRYSSDYVNKLYHMVKRNMSIPFQFHCLTDDPTGIVEGVSILPIPKDEKDITGWWHKISIFKRDFYGLKGDLLFIDLDMVIMNNIDDFFSFAPGSFCMVKNWFEKHVVSSCVMRITLGSYPEVYENFWNSRNDIMEKYSKPGDQLFIYHQIPGVSFWPENWVINYKKACNYRLVPFRFGIPQKVLNWVSHKFSLYTKEPKEGKILAFQQKPDMHEIIENPSGRYRASPWLKKYWQ